MKRKVILGTVLTLSVLWVAGQAVFAEGTEHATPTAAQQSGEMMRGDMGGMMNMMGSSGMMGNADMQGMMNMMNNPGMQQMMQAMNSPEGQQMMAACSNFMNSKAQQQPKQEQAPQQTAPQN